MLIFSVFAQTKIGERRNNGNVEIDIQFNYPKIVHKDGVEGLLTYQEPQKINDQQWNVRVCKPAEVDSKLISNIPIKTVEKEGVAYEDTSNKVLDLSTTQCENITLQGDKGDLIRIGSNSVEFYIDELNANFVVSPEEKVCEGTYCTKEISIKNLGTSDFVFDDFSCWSDVESAISVEYYRNYTFTEKTLNGYITKNQKIPLSLQEIPFTATRNITRNTEDCEETCFVTGQVTEMVTGTFLHKVNHTIKLSPQETFTFELKAILSAPNIRAKHNDSCTFFGQTFVIDPYFNTTSTQFNNGTYNRTQLTSTYIELNSSDVLQELPKSKTKDCFLQKCINMTGNVLYYRFNNDSAFGESNSKVFDFSYSGHNATPVGSPGFATGFLGEKAYYNNGANNYYWTTPDTAELSINYNITIFAWVKIYSIISDDQVVRKGNDYSLRFATQVGNKVNIRWIFHDGVEFRTYVTDNQTFPLNEWHHVAVTYTSDAGVGTGGTIYYDGKTVPASWGTGDGGQTIQNSASAVTIPGSSAAVNMSFDEVTIFDRVFSGKEIERIYKVQKSTYYPEGQYLSEVLDAGQNASYKNITLSASTVNGQNNITFFYRGCAAQNCDNTAFTESTQQINNGANTLQLDVNNSRYFQYLFLFDANDTSVSPLLYNLSVLYSHLPEAIFIFNVSEYGMEWVRFRWE